MEQQVESISKMYKLQKADTPEEHQIRKMVMQAQDEDKLFEQTGVEIENFNY